MPYSIICRHRTSFSRLLFMPQPIRQDAFLAASIAGDNFGVREKLDLFELKSIYNCLCTGCIYCLELRPCWKQIGNDLKNKSSPTERTCFPWDILIKTELLPTDRQ